MKRSNVRPAVCPITHRPHAAAVSLLLSAVPAEDINRQRRPPVGAQQQIALSSKCEKAGKTRFFKKCRFLGLKFYILYRPSSFRCSMYGGDAKL